MTPRPLVGFPAHRLLGGLAQALLLSVLLPLAPSPVRAQTVPPPPPPSLLDVMGHYGSGLTEIVVYEDGGLLAATTEGRTLRLFRTGPRAYAVRGGPPWVGETMDFLPDSGRAVLLRLARYTFSRRARGPEEGDVFRIAPLRPVADLLAEARLSRSPHGPGRRRADLVDLRAFVPNVMLDVRYATPRNFMGTTLYPAARAIAQRPAALALAAVQRDLARHALGLVVYDAYRPWYVTKAFWDATPPEQRGFVANPADGSQAQPGLRRGHRPRRPANGRAHRDAQRLRRVHAPRLLRLPRRHEPRPLLPRPAPDDDGGPRLLRQPHRVVALRPRRVPRLRRAQHPLRGHTVMGLLAIGCRLLAVG